MLRPTLAYIVGCAIAPLIAAAISLLVLRFIGPLHIFEAETIWDLMDQTAPSLGFFVMMGVLPALLFLGPVAYVVRRSSLGLSHSAWAGAVAGLAFFAYAAGYAALLEHDIHPPHVIHLTLFWFLGTNFGDVLAATWFRNGVLASLYALAPIGAGALAGAIFHILGRAEPDR